MACQHDCNWKTGFRDAIVCKETWEVLIQLGPLGDILPNVVSGEIVVVT